MTQSRPIRFVRALVLASGVSSLGVSCGRAELVSPDPDAGQARADAGRGTGDGGLFDAGLADAGAHDAGGQDAGNADAGAIDAGPFNCASCTCFVPDSGRPDCVALGHFECCPAIGPLNPPNLPA